MDQTPANLAALRRRLATTPDQPGIYLFVDGEGRLLYVGKALSLRKRVASYFRNTSALPPRIAQMMRSVADMEFRTTASEAEALLLEARLIKERRPRYNVAFRDDKTYPMLKITDEPFPRLLVTRRRSGDAALYFGPYTDATLMREAVHFLRRVFPLRTCRTFPKSPCLEYHLGQCLAPCVARISKTSYQRIVDDLAAFLNGEREQLLKELARRMDRAARDQRFEEAARLRNQIQALTSIIVAKEKSLAAGPLEQLQAALKLPRLPQRIEAFDISNTFGTFAVGSMVVFADGKPHKAHYRKFRIETVQGIDDVRMMREVIRRRYRGTLARELPLPDLILVDGGKGQLGAALDELRLLSLSIPSVGLAKRFEQLILPHVNQPVMLLPTSPVLHLVQRIRDEAHRFAIAYHRTLRGKTVSVSALHEVPGIGPRKAAKLLAHFGSLKRFAAAPPEEVAKVAHISRTAAEEALLRIRGPVRRVFRMPTTRRSDGQNPHGI